MAKDFSKIQTGSVYGNLSKATSRQGQQDTATKEEIALRKSAMMTRGRKGCKADRINMAFSTENYRFLKIVARASGVTMTELGNRIITEYRKAHNDLYQQAVELFNQLPDLTEDDED